MDAKRLRVLALHSFRTSAKIFIEQMRRAGLDAAIGDLVDIVYVDAPHLASGPIPNDVAPFFQGPYYEWWNAIQDPDTQKWRYFGWEQTLAFITDYIALHGPFDGLMAFSQGTVLASLLIAMQRQGIILQVSPCRNKLYENCNMTLRFQDLKNRKYMGFASKNNL
eukprot:jgi/Botrbrau1/11744/Bobra.0195s0070.2